MITGKAPKTLKGKEKKEFDANKEQREKFEKLQKRQWNLGKKGMEEKKITDIHDEVLLFRFNCYEVISDSLNFPECHSSNLRPK